MTDLPSLTQLCHESHHFTTFLTLSQLKASDLSCFLKKSHSKKSFGASVGFISKLGSKFNLKSNLEEYVTSQSLIDHWTARMKEFCFNDFIITKERQQVRIDNIPYDLATAEH